MSTTLLAPIEISAHPKPTLEALDLWAPLETARCLRDLPLEELAGAARRGIRHRTEAGFYLCAVLAEAARQCKDEDNPKGAFTHFCKQVGISYGLGRQHVRVFRYLPAEYWADFRELDWSVILAVEAHTYVKGETLDERQARILDVLHQAKGMTVEQAEHVAREVTGQARAALDVLTPLPAEVGVDSTTEPDQLDERTPPPGREPAPRRETVLDLAARTVGEQTLAPSAERPRVIVVRLTDGNDLERFLRKKAPGTYPLIVEAVREFEEQRIRQLQAAGELDV